MKYGDTSYTYSFDIFDTCFVRTCGKSSNVFNLVGRKILGKDADTSEIKDFVRVRIEGEKKARKELTNTTKEEITIEEIYDYCDFCCVTRINKKTILQTELETEEEVLFPIFKTKEHINRLHNSGHNVIYISDMYLPKYFIVKILKKHGFFVTEQIVFISSDIKKTKETGHIFDYIKDDLRINTKDWTHEGDNKTSDYFIPKSKGIRSIIRQHPFNYYEKKCIRRLFIDSDGEIFNTYSLCRAIRLSLENSPQNEFASNFVAPIFVPYVYNIMNDAQKKGISRLFFISRDGYILFLIAKVFSTIFKDIELHYFYASRKSLYLPGLENINYKEIKDIVPLDRGIDGILYALSIPDFDYSHISLRGLNNEQILKKLCNDSFFIEAIKQKHLEQGNLCVKYFKQEGLDKPQSAIVDILGSRRCQRYMNNILRRNGLPEVFAYYFEVTWNRINCNDKYIAQNYQESFINVPTYHHVFQPLYEQYFAITDQERTIGYQDIEGVITPIKEKDPISYDYKRKIFEANKTVCILFAQQLKAHPLINPELCIRIAQYSLGEFCHIPQRGLLNTFSGFYCTDGNQRYPLLVKKSLLHIIFNRKKYFRWLEGNIVFNSGCLYKIVKLILSIRFKRKINL